MNLQSLLFAAIIAAIGAAVFHAGIPLLGVPIIVVAIFVAFALRIAAEWNRAVVLRLGRFASIRGPGVYFVIPIIETVYAVVDIRRQSTVISAENTLTLDAVSVTVDSIMFWQVEDVERVATKVIDYKSIIAQVAQTSLREVISAMSLNDVLAQRETMDQRIKDLVTRKSSSWGIGNISVEIRDVKIPNELKDAMSRNAQAEKEKQARVTLASAEIAIAEQVVAAAKIYEASPVALQIRQMGLIYDMNKDRGATILVPTDLVTALSPLARKPS